MAKIALKLTLGGLKCPQSVEVEHKTCRSMCGTPVQSTSHFGPSKFDWVGRGGQGRSKSALEWLKSGFGAVQRPLNGSMTPEMDPKWSPQLPMIDSSPFSNLLKHYSLYILNKTISDGGTG